MIKMRQLTDGSLYRVMLDDRWEGVTTGKSLKSALRHGKATELKPYRSATNVPPSGFILVEVNPDEFYIAVRCFDPESLHRAEVVHREVVLAPLSSQTKLEPPRTLTMTTETKPAPLRRFGKAKPVVEVMLEPTVEVVFETPALAPKKKWGFKR